MSILYVNRKTFQLLLEMSKDPGNNENIVSKSSQFLKSSVTFIKLFPKADCWEIKTNLYLVKQRKTLWAWGCISVKHLHHV